MTCRWTFGVPEDSEATTRSLLVALAEWLTNSDYLAMLKLLKIPLPEDQPEEQAEEEQAAQGEPQGVLEELPAQEP